MQMFFKCAVKLKKLNQAKTLKKLMNYVSIFMVNERAFLFDSSTAIVFIRKQFIPCMEIVKSLKPSSVPIKNSSKNL
jgi:hypothetical protein